MNNQAENRYVGKLYYVPISTVGSGTLLMLGGHGCPPGGKQEIPQVGLQAGTPQ